MTRTQSAILGGFVAVLVTAVVVFVLVWATRFRPIIAMAGDGTRSNEPFSAKAAAVALVIAPYSLIVFGVPAFLVGVVIGACWPGSNRSGSR